MDKKNYQKPSTKAVMVQQHLLGDDNSTQEGETPGNSREYRSFFEEE